MTDPDAPDPDSAAPRRSVRRYAMATLRLGVTIGLLCSGRRKTTPARAGGLFPRPPPPLLAAAVAALAATTPINALRWRALLAPGPPLPTAFTVLKILLVGIFFNQVL